MSGDDDYSHNYAALGQLYEHWMRGEPGRCALVAGGTIRQMYTAQADARAALLALPHDVPHALIVALWPRGGWRHPRFVVDSYRRHADPPPDDATPHDTGARHDATAPVPPPPAPSISVGTEGRTGAPHARGAAGGTGITSLLQDFLVVERLRHVPLAPDDLREPYLLVKDGRVLGRYTRVTRARQVVDAAMPPLAPIVFASLRPGRVGPFSLIVLQALLSS